MKKETWKTIIQVVISILTAALTAMGTTSCMGCGPFSRKSPLTVMDETAFFIYFTFYFSAQFITFRLRPTSG